MKYFLFLFGVLLFNFSVNSQTLNNPESVVYDEVNNRYLVSNASTTDHKGEIHSIDPNTQEISSFISNGLSSPKGLTIIKETLYCTDKTEVKGFNLTNGSLEFIVKIEDSRFLNDITSDGVNLYISDNIKNKIYSINISTKKITTLIAGGNLSRPNGLFYNSESNSLLICSFRANSPIQNYDLNLNLLSLVALTSLGQLDGITMDQNGNYYVSSWFDNSIYKFDPLFAELPEQISNGHYGPADIFYDIKNDKLAIPNFNSNVVSLLDMSKNEEDISLNPFDIKIYPNPTSGIFTLYFKLEGQTSVNIQIINKSGKITYSLKEDNFSTEEFQKINIDSKSCGLTKGVYFIKIILGDEVFMKRIVILE